jgi:formylglycine-generating enzyme
MSDAVQGSCCSTSRSEFMLPANQQVKALPENGAVIGSELRKGMVLLPGGTFRMGNGGKDGFPGDGEGPVHEVTLRPFYVDACTVTNAQFEKFVGATRYKTEAERFGWSYVFAPFLSPVNSRFIIGSPQGTPWWYAVKEAYWFQPEGPGSNLQERMDHPAVHLSWHDALA